MKQIILITAGTKEMNEFPKSVILTNYYIEYIRNAGGTPIIVSEEKKKNFHDLVKISNGLFLTGGGDCHPKYFGEEDENPGYIYDDKRDQMEYDLIRLFMREEKPVMGICRGFQMINIACGGSLHQDIYQKLNICHPERQDHYVRAKEGSWWGKQYGKRFKVNSFHHQALNKLGENLEPVVFDELSGIVEAIEHKYRPVYGVQWHPERMDNMHKYVDRFMSDVDNCLAFQKRFV